MEVEITTAVNCIAQGVEFSGPANVILKAYEKTEKGFRFGWQLKNKEDLAIIDSDITEFDSDKEVDAAFVDFLSGKFKISKKHIKIQADGSEDTVK